MALKTDIRGMVWKYPDTFVVGREQIRQYAGATKSNHPATVDEKAAAELGHDALIAPLTFVAILANLIQRHFFQHVDVGLETMQIVQVDQKFQYHRPIKAGDELHGTMYVVSVEERFGADIVVTRNICTDMHGEIVLEAYTTMMGHEGDHSISVKWDAESGQVMRTAVGE
ncbi:MAG TPA: (3R)-hydroxyacyl-ACP dehydratase subunit HadC [Mycobacterium sp.]|jgi:acyl dehydratase|nr:(3R)-hydroxyacyl-ACP dehydratase subunit HadC [Mycobacterium sp.]HEX4587443.1 (3R)-hydroxyacyl-ACP dehydratase subunit HadC [Mycobacterium sp.]